MKRTLRSCFACVVAWSLTALPMSPALPAAESAYYVSQSSGNDAYDGRAAVWDGTHGPWKTLARASSSARQPGDRLLLKCGDVWDETLTLRGDGTATNPVIVTSHGTGQRPYIHRKPGNRTACVVIDNASGYVLRNLEL